MAMKFGLLGAKRRFWVNQRHRLRRNWLPLVMLGFALSVILAVIPDSSSAIPRDIELGWQGWLTLLVTLIAFLANALTSLAAEVVFLGAVAVLYIAGVLSTDAALAGFSNPGMVTVGVLYIVVTGLEQTGGLDVISQMLLGLPKGQTAALVRLVLPVMGLSAFLNNTPVVAMFIPVVTDWCRKLRISPSKLMIPLSYAAIMGGMCTLIGTSTNLVVNGLVIAETDLPGLGMFEVAWVGIPCVAAGSVLLWLASRWWLPDRKPAISEGDDPRQYTVEMVVETGSPVAGKTVEQAGLRHLPGLYLVEIQRNQELLTAISPREVLREHDQLVFVGAVTSIVDLHQFRGLKPATDQVFKLNTPAAIAPWWKRWFLIPAPWWAKPFAKATSVTITGRWCWPSGATANASRVKSVIFAWNPATPYY
jgi:di/tricarboxylate transporter